MDFFVTSRSKIIESTRVQVPVNENNQKILERDFSRIQIPGKLYIKDNDEEDGASNEEKTDSVASPPFNPDRENFQNFFFSYFKDIPYVQGMITGTLVEQLMKSTEEELMEFQTNSHSYSVNFCFKTDEGSSWQGVTLRLNLETLEWYAVITDFSSPEGKVAIMGEGAYYNQLKKKLSNDLPQTTLHFIQNSEVKEALTHIPIQLEMAKINKNKLSYKNIYAKCLISFMVKCGCAQYANAKLIESTPKLDELDRVEPIKKSWFSFRRT